MSNSLVCTPPSPAVVAQSTPNSGTSSTLSPATNTPLSIPCMHSVVRVASLGCRGWTGVWTWVFHWDQALREDLVCVLVKGMRDAHTIRVGHMPAVVDNEDGKKQDCISALQMHAMRKLIVLGNRRQSSVSSLIPTSLTSVTTANMKLRLSQSLATWNCPRMSPSA